MKKALIIAAVTAKQICAFVFAYADCWFSHEAAHLPNTVLKNLRNVSAGKNWKHKLFFIHKIVSESKLDYILSQEIISMYFPPPDKTNKLNHDVYDILLINATIVKLHAKTD